MNLSKYTPERSQHEIAAVFVTDYYAVELTDAHEAFYVIGSDVLGPMGHELIPFKDEASAKEFQEDHKGTRILRFKEVTEEVIDALDAAQQPRGRKR
jgi:nitrous oxide reductase accessory protein NosL